MIKYNDILDESFKSLREPCENLRVPISDEDKAIFDQMVEYVTISQQDGMTPDKGYRPSVGIAAPQIGVNKKMCYCRVAYEDEVMELFMANPIIKSKGSKTIYLANGEGCLSVKRDTEGYVPRYATVEIQYLDVYTNRKKKVKLTGFDAIVAQHEIDHLHGVLFVDKVVTKDKLPEDAIEI